MDGGLTAHGTCMASLAAGTISGTSKDATIIPMKAFQNVIEASFAVWAEIFAIIVENIELRDKKGNSVISMSFGKFCFGVPS
jgi:hypothetical protein